MKNQAQRFKISDDEVESFLEMLSVKEKKEEIKDLFINHNYLSNEEEYRYIGNSLARACMIGDLDLIEILLCEQIEVKKGIFYKINRRTKTASLYGIRTEMKVFTVPRTIQYESEEYLVTSISGDDWIYPKKIECIQFSEGSEVSAIYERSFLGSPIKCFHIPEKFVKFGEESLFGARKLTTFVISPKNDRFVFKENKYLLGKSDTKSDNYDFFLFARRDIGQIKFPSNVKIIASCAFESCCGIKKVQIPPDSKLEIIGSYSFAYTNINEIYIPSTVLEICESAFESSLIKRYEIKDDSKLKIIGTKAFYNTGLKQVYIPPSVLEIHKEAFHASEIKKIIFLKNSQLKIIGMYAFERAAIKDISIPSTVTKICYGAFAFCKNLRKIDIPQDSNLQTIENEAFKFTEIDSIFLPEKLIELNDEWCNCANSLTKIIVSPKNDRFAFKENKYLVGKSDIESDVYDTLIFASRDINELEFPSEIKIIASYAFQFCQKIKTIKFQPDSKLQIINRNAFENSLIKYISIPPTVSKICSNAFEKCYVLLKVEIPSNSSLQSIDEETFQDSSITSIYIPQFVSKISQKAFNNCFKLNKIEFSQNSKLNTIETCAFYYTSISSISIPKSVSEIEQFAFCISNLIIVEIDDESKLEHIKPNVFVNCPNLILMVPKRIEVSSEQIIEDFDE